MQGKAFNVFWFQISSPEDPVTYYKCSLLLHFDTMFQLLYVIFMHNCDMLYVISVIL